MYCHYESTGENDNILLRQHASLSFSTSQTPATLLVTLSMNRMSMYFKPLSKIRASAISNHMYRCFTFSETLEVLTRVFTQVSDRNSQCKRIRIRFCRRFSPSTPWVTILFLNTLLSFHTRIEVVAPLSRKVLPPVTSLTNVTFNYFLSCIDADLLYYIAHYHELNRFAARTTGDMYNEKR